MTQEVLPAPTEPTTQPAPETAPPATDTAPATEIAPATPDTTATDSNTPDTSAADAAPARKATRSAPKRTAAVPVAKSHPAAPATHAPAAVATAPAATGPAPSAPAAAPTATEAAINDAARNPAPAPTAAPAKTNGNNDMALELGGGALALLALGGAALAISRRRRHEEEEEWSDEQAMEPVAAEPVSAVEPAPIVQPRHDRIVQEQPAIVAPAASAFAWGPRDSNQADDDDGSDRQPGESWIERAYRGPSPANPSVSLKNRLRRAAFFDKRERDVAAGKAEPVDTDAGLPDAMVEEREFA